MCHWFPWGRILTVYWREDTSMTRMRRRWSMTRRMMMMTKMMMMRMMIPERRAEQVQLLLFDACARPAARGDGPISVAEEDCRKK